MPPTAKKSVCPWLTGNDLGAMLVPWGWEAADWTTASRPATSCVTWYFLPLVCLSTYVSSSVNWLVSKLNHFPCFQCTLVLHPKKAAVDWLPFTAHETTHNSATHLLPVTFSSTACLAPFPGTHWLWSSFSRLPVQIATSSIIRLTPSILCAHQLPAWDRAFPLSPRVHIYKKPDSVCATAATPPPSSHPITWQIHFPSVSPEQNSPITWKKKKSRVTPLIINHELPC